ncbi:hypothetical protein C8J57DRAFT_1732774 [Mycena rebaudengoi]|nr:hypothetical protein C8J57DRAFT_1732774 [Mycena rebaudengoi]
MRYAARRASPADAVQIDSTITTARPRAGEECGYAYNAGAYSTVRRWCVFIRPPARDRSDTNTCFDRPASLSAAQARCDFRRRRRL